MAAITSTPTNLQGCYDKLIYTYTNTIVGNANVMSIEVKVYIDSVLIATLKVLRRRAVIILILMTLILVILYKATL